MNDITKKLRTLSTCYYVLAVLGIPAAFVSPVIMLQSVQNTDDEMKSFIIILTVASLIASLVMAVGIGAVGYGLRKQCWWTYCFVISILLCPSFPIGMALGIFTLLTLNKPEAKQLFTQPVK